MEFKEIYTANFKRIFAYILAKMQNRTAAEDVCTIAWQHAFDRFDQYDRSKGVIEQWLFAIAKNEIRKYYRLKYIKSFFSLDLFEYSFKEESRPDEEYANSLQKQQLFDALNTLTENEREVLTLKYYSDLNNREIAKITKLSESNVGTLALRAKQKVKRILGDEDEEI